MNQSLQISHQDVNILELNLREEEFDHGELVIHLKRRVEHRLQQRREHNSFVAQEENLILEHNPHRNVNPMPLQRINVHDYDESLLKRQIILLNIQKIDAGEEDFGLILFEEKRHGAL